MSSPGDRRRLFFANSLAFPREPGQFFIDPESGKLYYKPRVDENMTRLQAVLPRLEMLVSIAGSYDRRVTDLNFVGIAFRHTSWLGSSSAEGYVSQQSGSYLAGWIPDLPCDPIRDCSWACWTFETMRNRWQQQPAAVQVADATRVTFNRPNLPSLGQIALGIGNNPEANESGVGYGAAAVEVRRSRFAELAGGAIMVGGIRPDAHHPPQPEMGDRNIFISDNRIENVSQDYMEQAAILVTYAPGAIVTHNDISGAPYDGIDVGWDWGINDSGGSGAYRSRARGYYDQPGNHVYDTPTILRDTVTVRGNVVDGSGIWLNANTMDSFRPRRPTVDNLPIGNWYNGRRLNGW